MSLRAAFMRLCLCAALAGATQACTEPRAQTAATEQCRARIVVGFAAPMEPAAIAALAAARDLGLGVVARLLPDLYTLDLEADGPCAAALERLRTDPSIRSAEPEGRRRANSG